jgi:hypothetical protein
MECQCKFWFLVVLGKLTRPMDVQAESAVHMTLDGLDIRDLLGVLGRACELRRRIVAKFYTLLRLDVRKTCNSMLFGFICLR